MRKMKVSKRVLIGAAVVVVVAAAVLIFSGCVTGKAGGSIPNSCNDTDSGKIFGVKGTVSGYAANKPYSKTDYCKDAGHLLEYYCDKTNSRSVTSTCSAGNTCRDGACVPPCTPTAEICDNIDNDCDTSIDEGLSKQCGSTDTGECAYGTQTCTAGVYGSCVGNVGPVTEVCDGKDNDCDNSTDEALGSTTCGTGACQRTVQNCISGVAQTCVPGTAGTETCNNIDDDCDGVVDDGCECINGQTRICGTNVGECEYGNQTCNAGSWSSCTGGINPATEICDGRDNDCDAQVDEGCDCMDGTSRVCGTNAGECRYGNQTCASGAWGGCIGAINATAEICDAKDNDCDAVADEDSVCDSCMDSDGGVTPGTRGNVTGILNMAAYTYTDLCINPLTLIEYMCSGARMANVTVNCMGNITTNCSSGACR